MKRIRYTKFTGDLSSSLDLEDLLQALSDFLLDSGFQDPGTTWTSPPTIIPQAGIYWFVCLVPGHFQSGMWGHLYVGVAPTPAASIPQMQGVIQYAYLALGAVVIGGAAFLVLMGQNERAVSAAPAQRPASKD